MDKIISMASTVNSSQLNEGGTNSIKDFQTTTDIKSKKDKEFGLKVARNISANIQSAYFSQRNIRFGLNRRLANGKQDINEFKKIFDPTSEMKYLHMKFKAIMIVATTVQRTVGRWMQNMEKVIVTAVDPISVKQKDDEYDRAEFTMDHKELLAELDGQAGLPLVPKDQFIPEDKEDLDLWKAEEQKLMEEEKFEIGTNEVLRANGWFDVIKQKVLTDSAEVGLLAAHVKSMSDGMISVKWLMPEDLIYSDSVYPDFRDTSWRGYRESMKIIEIREEYSNISEEIMFDIAKKSSNFKSSNLFGFDNDWVTCQDRPYDDWSVPVITFYIKTSDRDGYQMKVTKAGSLMIDKKDKPSSNPNKPFMSKDKYNIYKGVFVEGSEIMLEWGLEKNMIRPQDPQEIGDVEFPISMFMYNMYKMRNLAIPEKIEEPVEQMVITRLKIQQIVVKMRPPGNAYDVDSMQELDLGLGEGNMFSPLELQKVNDQTGDFYFRGKDAEGNKIDLPIRPQPNSEGLPQLQGLIAVYNHHLQVLRDEVGINENAEGQSPKARVTTDNFNNSVQLSFNATDYMYDAYLWLMADVAKKVGCLLHDSVMYGGKPYKKILDKEDVKGRVFSSKAEMLPTEHETAYVDSLITQAIQANPQFIMYCNPFQLRRMAKENVKKAERMFLRAQKDAIKGTLQQAQANSEMASKAQQESAKATADGEAMLKDKDAQIKEAQIKLEGDNANKTSVLNMFTQLFSKGVGIPAELMPLSAAVIQNVMLPLIVENEAQRMQIQQAMQQQPPQQTMQPQEQMQE